MSVPPIEELELLHNNICRALGEPKRIQILYALHNQPCHVNGLAEQLDIPQPTVSRHLAVLRQAGVVSTRKDGINVYYRLRSSKISEACQLTRSREPPV